MESSVLCRGVSSGIPDLLSPSRAGQRGCETQTEVISSPHTQEVALQTAGRCLCIALQQAGKAALGIKYSKKLHFPSQRRAPGVAPFIPSPGCCETGTVWGRKNWITREWLLPRAGRDHSRVQEWSWHRTGSCAAALHGLQLHPFHSHTQRKL